MLETVEKKNLPGKITVGPCSIDGHRRKWLWQRQNGPGNGYTREENDRRKKNEQYIFTCVCVCVFHFVQEISRVSTTVLRARSPKNEIAFLPTIIPFHAIFSYLQRWNPLNRGP